MARIGTWDAETFLFCCRDTSNYSIEYTTMQGKSGEHISIWNDKWTETANSRHSNNYICIGHCEKLRRTKTRQTRHVQWSISTRRGTKCSPHMESPHRKNRRQEQYSGKWKKELVSTRQNTKNDAGAIGTPYQFHNIRESEKTGECRKHKKNYNIEAQGRIQGRVAWLWIENMQRSTIRQRRIPLPNMRQIYRHDARLAHTFHENAQSWEPTKYGSPDENW